MLVGGSSIRPDSTNHLCYNNLSPTPYLATLSASMFGDGMLVIDLLYVSIGKGIVLSPLCPASSHVIGPRLCVYVCLCLFVCPSVRLFVYEASKFCCSSGTIFHVVLTVLIRTQDDSFMKNWRRTHPSFGITAPICTDRQL